ncbi:ATP-dependent Clp protease adaptor ClpS, partial [Helicobacter canadensis]
MPKQNQIENATETLEKLQEPIRYKVILLNDDYTTQDFVIEILQKVFHKGFEESLNLML